MSTTNHDSSMDMDPAELPVGPAGAAAQTAREEGGIWLDGGVLACACPECSAPMSIRLWLMVADCFRCGTSIELTEEQEQEALRLLKAEEETRQVEAQAAAATIAPTMLPKTPVATQRKTEPIPVAAPPPPATETPTAKPSDAPAADVRQSQPRPRRVAASEVYRGPRAHVRDLYEKGGASLFWDRLFRDLPAWLVSLVVHLVALLLLALWVDPPKEDKLEITLATGISDEELAGDATAMDDSLDDAFDMGEYGGFEQRCELDDLGAVPEPDPLPIPPNDLGDRLNPVGRMPSVERQPVNTTLRAPPGHMLTGRDPQVREHFLKQSGGTSATEAAVARGLIFLARHQHEDGSWSLANFNTTRHCDRTCNGQLRRPRDDSRVAATAMSLLPFLGAGQTHKKGKYPTVVFKGLGWLLEQQQENGDLRDRDSRGNLIGRGQMYAHGQATIVLCEAYLLTGDPQLRAPAQLALNFIVDAQDPHGGGWRYKPREAGDTSVVGWQMMALKTGQLAYLRVPPETFDKAGLFLNSVTPDGAKYSYQPRGGTTRTMTAEALLCRQYLGWPRGHEGLKKGVDFLLEEGNLPRANDADIYYWYYGSQVLHHYGGEEWEIWNDRMKSVLLATQEKNGHSAGSWSPRGKFADAGGRIYMTALAICTLEVYYRHLGIYSQEAAGVE